MLRYWTAFAPPAFGLRRAAEGRGLDRALATSSVNRYAGLWVGNARGRKVSQAQNGSLEPTPVAGLVPPGQLRIVDRPASLGLVDSILDSISAQFFGS